MVSGCGTRHVSERTIACDEEANEEIKSQYSDARGQTTVAA